MARSSIISPGLRRSLTGITVLVLVFVYVPLTLVVVNSFNIDNTFGFPPPGYTLHWWQVAWESQGARSALWTSVKVAIAATVVALLLGTLAAMALRRTRFFGRNVVSLLIILPIALPGVVTGLAFQNGFRTILGIQLSLWTIVIAHATFCIVTIFNNVQARFQRLGGNFEQASMDLGAGRWTTFRLVTFPMLRSALLAGALLSFGLSFDEIVVTTFTASSQDQTLPIWIFSQLFRPRDRPVTNVVAIFVVLVTALPILLAHRITQRADDTMG